ncbi:MAG: T9SS type A sorting domain-containing protein [Rhodothermaceae bacterium]
MKKHSITIFKMLVAVAVLTVGLNTTFAQRVVKVDQGVGTLNNTIAGDTTATGDRVDLNTIYELSDGGYYVLSGSLEFGSIPIHIRAEEGSTNRPILIPGVDDGGNSGRAFRVKGNLTLEGVYVTNMDEKKGINKNLIRASADDIRIILRNCHIDRDTQSGIRIDNDNMKIYIYNTVFSNIGLTTDPDNGRAIDDRGNSIDTLVIENSTFYNLTSTVLRDGGGLVNHFVYNHNTAYNIGQRGFDFGQAKYAEVTNSVFANCGFFGQPPAETEFLRAVIVGDTLDGQSIVIKNNVVFADPAIATAQPDTVDAIPLYDAVTQKMVNDFNTGENMYTETLTFTTAPAVPTQTITSYYADPSTAAELDDGGGSGEYGGTQLPFDYAYANTSAAYAQSTAGQPLGALTWFDMYITGIEDDLTAPELPGNYVLGNNYPNPFNPATSIEYSIPEETNVKIVVFNSIGQEVKTLVNEVQQAGTYTTEWDGTTNSGVAASGIYFYQLRAGEAVIVKKMVLLK